MKMLLHRFKKRLNRLLFGVGVGSGGGGRGCVSTGAGTRVSWLRASITAGWVARLAPIPVDALAVTADMSDRGTRVVAFSDRFLRFNIL